MGLGKTYSTKYLLDSNNSSGVAGQVLSTTSTGIDWVDANTVPGTGLWLANGNDIYNSNSGNVGIGTTSPASRFVVLGGNSGVNDVDRYVRFKASNGEKRFDFYVGGTGNGSRLSMFDHDGTTEGIRLQAATNGNNHILGQLGIGVSSPGTALQVGGLDDGSNYDITLGWNAVSSQAVGTKRSALTFKTSQTAVNNEDIYKWDIAMVTAPATASNEPFGSNLAFLRSTRSSTSVDETTMILTQLGNVGIGTTSPGSKLQVYSTALRDISIFGHGTQAQNNWQAEHAFFISAGQGVMISKANASNNTNRLHLFYNTTNGDAQYMLHDTSSVNKVKLNTNGDSYFNGGNVGINTTSPEEKLHVIGSTLISNNEFYKVEGTTGTNYKIAGLTNGNVIQIGAIDYTSAGTIFAGGDNISITTGGASGSTRMKIDSSGNVGIGTTSPVEKLEVSGSVRVGNMKFEPSNAGRIGFNRNTSNGVIYNSSYAAHQINGASASSNFLEIQSYSTGGVYEGSVVVKQGAVGIGTTSPSEKLVVQDGKILAGHTNTRGYGFHDLSNYSYTANTGRLSLVSNGIEAVSIDSSQNVGIGTTSPSQKLHVSGNARVTGAYYDSNNSAGTSGQVLSSTGSATSWVSGSGLPGGPYLPLAGGTMNSSANINMNSGTLSSVDYIDFGIGQLNGVSTSNLILKSLGDITYNVDSNNNGNSSHIFQESGSELMRIRYDGNVGIGTTNPTNKLHIQGGQATVYSSTDSGGQASAGTTINNTNTAGNTNNFSQLLFTIGTNNNSVSRIVAIRSGSDASDLAFVGKSTAGVAEYMRIKSGGNVGIGVDNPSALLEVRKGTISGQIAKFSAINPHVVIESSTAGNAVLHLKPNVTGSKSGQFKVTAGNGYNFRWTNDAAGTGETAYMDLDTSTTGGGDLTVKGDVIAYGSPSDKKYKENIKPIESALDKAMQLQGVTFNWKDSESILEIKEDIGFIAQDVQEVLPELVRDNGKGNLSLRYQGITPILLEAIKELKAEIEELKLNNCNCNK